MQQRLNFPVIQKTNAKAGPSNTLPLPRSNPLPQKQAPTLVGPPACPEIAELEGVEWQRDCLHVLVGGSDRLSIGARVDIYGRGFRGRGEFLCGYRQPSVLCKSQMVIMVSLCSLDTSTFQQEAVLAQILSITDWAVGARIIAHLLHHGHLSHKEVKEMGGMNPLEAASPGSSLRERVGIYVHVTTLKHMYDASDCLYPTDASIVADRNRMSISAYEIGPRCPETLIPHQTRSKNTHRWTRTAHLHLIDNLCPLRRLVSPPTILFADSLSALMTFAPPPRVVDRGKL